MKPIADNISEGGRRLQEGGPAPQTHGSQLRVLNLSAHYQRIQVLRGVTFHVRPQEIVALIGPNGAGKSTLLQVISGLKRPSRGEVIFAGESIAGLAPDKIVSRGLLQVPEQRQIFASMTVAENLELGAYSLPREQRRAAAARIKEVYQLFPILAERGRLRAGSLSGGEQQMLSIARALMAQPRLLLLDEPSFGLAPLVVEEIFAVIQRLRQRGTTILLVEQNARAALEVCDRAYVLEAGRIVLEGSPAELAANDELRRAYLGRDYRWKWER